MKKTNKLISILLVLAMLLSMAPLSLTASAASEAIELRLNNYYATKVDYSNSATQYYQYNNYLYKAAYSNLKNISEVAIEYDRYDQLALSYTESDTGDAANINLIASYQGSTAKLSNLPTAPGKSVSFYTTNTAASNEKKPVITVTCMAVNEPVWSWSDSSATAAFTSTDGKATMTVTATIESSEQTAATCLENDKTTYTATATANGKAYTNEKTVDGEQGPHSFEYSGDDVIGRCTNGCGYECPHENQTGETCEICGAVLHTHSFTYTAGGSRIVATCVAGDCPLENGIGGMLTISAPADLYVDGTAKEATVENNLVDTSVAISDITYSAPYGLPPKDAGTYTASVTVGGATATVEFTLLNYAAKVTDKDGNELSDSPYKTLADAITAASASEGSTVTLLDDITLTTRQGISSGTFTLDLNGNNLVNETDSVFYIYEEVDLTIKDNGEGGTVETKRMYVDCIDNSGKLTVESGIIKGDGGIRNYGVLYFNDGTVETDYYPAITNYSDSTVYIYDGVLKSSNSGAVENGGTLYVYGGEIDGFFNVGTAYISGGKIDRDDYVALHLLCGTVEVTGGSFTGTDFSDGYFSGTPYGEWTIDIDEGATLILKGGEFPNGFVVANTTANTFLAEEYAFYDKDGNKITVADDAKIIDGYVQVKEHFVASVTDKDGNAVGTYKTFADAITAAQSSEDSTLTLLDDITLTETAIISSGKFILDLNGKTILNKTDDVLMVYYHANITIKDSCEGGTVQTNGATSQTIFNCGTLTIENGLFKGAAGIVTSGTLNFKNGKIEADTYDAIRNSGTVYIYNGSFTSIDAGAINVDTDGTAYIYDGEFSGFCGISNSGTAYIEGGEFKGNSYAAFNLYSGTVEVTGGSFTGTDFASGYYSGTPYGEWTVYYGEDATLTLKGGEFPNGFVIDETTANALLAEDYYYKDADGKLIDVADDAKIINGYVKVSKGADLADAVITLDETQFTYSGMEHKPTVIVTVGGKTLTEGKDYTLTFANNVNAGTATVTIKAIGQAAGGIAGGGENIGNSSNSGDITESVYTGEVTKEFAINKKPVTVTATAPDKVYDGTTDIDYDTIVITFDGIVEGDTVGYTIKEAWFNGINAGENKMVPVVFNVTGEDADNYSFPESGEYIAPDYFVETTADITAKDISDGFIILGAPLTYNGTEQTQTVEKVLPTGTAPEATYTVSGNKATNVGVYLLTVTGTGNFTGEAKIAYEIAPDVKCISHLDRVEDNGMMKWNVKSTDRASLEYVIDQLNNAVTDIADEDKKNEWADTKEACEDMLRIINSIELAITDVEEDYAGFSEDTVKSSDIPALDEIVSKVNEIKDRYGFYLTDEEAKKLEDILDGIEKLKAKIAETAEEIERIDEAVNGYDEETVTSDDIPELDKLIEDIKALTDSDNLTEDEKAALEETEKAIDELVEKLAEVAEEIKKVDEAVKS
ncbi:MAG: hypothetical protein IJA87_06750, partial [Clostridia bacterium]|nr:hypothetical protein [Clostridia bacterium]